MSTGSFNYLYTPTNGAVVSNGFIDNSLIYLNYTYSLPNTTILSNNAYVYPTWTLNNTGSKYPSTLNVNAIIDSNSNINIPSAGAWRIKIELYIINGSFTQNGSSVVLIGGNRVVTAVPTASYLGMELNYDAYLTSAAQVSKIGFQLNQWSNANLAGCSMTISRVSK